MSDNPVATFTNNLGYDVDIYDVFNPNDSVQGPLTYTKLDTVAKGASAKPVNTIHPASQLQAMRTGTITALSNNYYQQFPVAVCPVSILNDSNDFTLTSDQQAAMEDSFKFIKYSTANASSSMATNFRTALGNTDDQETAVDTFFAGTISFQKCTFITWIAVFTWQAQFTNPWQGTFYLYSLGTTSVPPALVATLVIATAASANPAVLTMAASGGQNTPVIMTGDGTMEEANPGTGSLSVTLNPTWMNITQTSQVNGQTVTTYAIGAAFTGTINGTSVAGNINQLTIPSTSDTGSNAKDKDAANILTLNNLFSVVGMLTSIGMLYYMAKGHKLAETQKEANVEKKGSTKQEVQEKQAQIQQDYEDNEIPLVNNRGKQLDTEVVPKVNDAYVGVDQALTVQSNTSVVQSQIKEMNTVLQRGAPSKATEDTAVSLATARNDLRKASSLSTSEADRATTLTKVDTNLKATSVEITTALQTQGSKLPKMESQALSNTKDAITETTQQTESVKKAQEDQLKENENEGNKDVNPEQFDDPKADPPATFTPDVV